MKHPSPQTAILPMTLRHYGRVVDLWRNCPGVAVGESDTRECIGLYLRRNRGLSLVALDGATVVGTILCGHDGRRGILHHLAVAPSHRRCGLGRQLVERALAGLRQAGIKKAWILILRNNPAGRRFWKSIGWKESENVLYAAKNL